MRNLPLLALTAIRLAAAARTPLSADEAYYWLWSRIPAWGYLDHPPMVAAWIHAGTSVFGDTAFGVRLLGPLAVLLGSLLLAGAAEDLAPGQGRGTAAALLFNATLICNAGAVIMTPDTPLLFFWTAALAALARLIRTQNPYWWLAVGAACGLALDSKYTAVLLGGGIVAWLILVPAARHWLWRWQLWAGGALALALFAPVLAWNAGHGWASFAKQGSRAGDWHPAEALRYLAELAGGQIGLATPFVAVIFAAALIRAGAALRRRQAVGGLLACVTLIPALAFLQHALGGRVQANWPAVIYPGAALAAACLGPALPSLWRPAVAMGLALSGLVLLQAAAAPFSLPRALDFTLIRLAGWQDLAGSVFVAQSQAHADFVAADEYGLASELAFRLRGPVLGVEKRWALFGLATPNLAGRTGILIRSDRAYGPPDPAPWASLAQIGTATRGRAGIPAETYRLYRVLGRAPGPPGPPAILLPANRALFNPS